MDINTDVKLLSMLGEPIKTALEPGRPPEELTLKTVLIQCLINESEGEKIEGKRKLDRYALALKVKDGGVVDLASEDITLLKDAVSKQFPVLVVGQVHRLLEGKPTGLEKKGK